MNYGLALCGLSSAPAQDDLRDGAGDGLQDSGAHKMLLRGCSHSQHLSRRLISESLGSPWLECTLVPAPNINSNVEHRVNPKCILFETGSLLA